MACGAVLSEQRSLQLEISGLRFVDPTGVALLHGLERRGTRLGGCSGFVNELLRERAPATTAPQSVPRSHPAGDTVLVERLRGGDPQAFELRLHRARQALRTLLQREFLGEAHRNGDRSQSRGPAGQPA